MQQHIKLLLEYSKELDILYVEDDRILADNTAELLENYFHSVDTVYDGKDGLDKYQEYSKANNRFYDIVITDIQMPKMDGIELCENILKKNEMQSIIITTAHNEINFLLSAIDLGIDGFLVKPLKTEQLIKVLFKTTCNVSDHKFVT